MPTAVFVVALRFVPILIVLLATGCASLPRVPFTANQQAAAQIPGIPGARYWADASVEEFAPVIHMHKMRAVADKVGSMDFLAISGGASDGAFGAGVLTGLTARGERPQFVFVSGVSAGALIAPLAFLGPAHDDELKRAWTSGIAAKVGEGGIFSLLFSQESRRTALYELVSSFIDEAMLREIASEHRRGRRLAVITTNIDAQRPVLWDLGAIAASGHPDALQLFRNILTASSSIPGAFAPTQIEVEADGRRFTELHVDGGATMQVFTIPESILLQDLPEKAKAKGIPARFFIIINNRLQPEFEVVEGSAVPLLSRSLSSLIKTHSRLTLIATLGYTQTRRIGFNLTYIDDEFPSEPKPSFETDYMRAVYNYGYDRAVNGRLWRQDIPFRGVTPRPAAALQ
ncbi:MAG: patatin-like phospholipase family protein [Rhodomicrobiaceae bacterium]